MRNCENNSLKTKLFKLKVILLEIVHLSVAALHLSVIQVQTFPNDIYCSAKRGDIVFKLF